MYMHMDAKNYKGIIYMYIECSATKFCNLIGQSVVSKSRRSHETWFLQISRG